MTDKVALAEAVGRGMLAADRASQALGITLVEAKPARSKLIMTVRADMLNGHGTCHGGFIFALADSAFAFACNSANVVTVAQHCSVSFLAPSREGDVLTAEAQERHRGRVSGLTDVTVSNQHGKTVAIFRGHSHQLTGEVVPGLGTAS